MKPILARGNHNTIPKLVRLKKPAEKDRAPRVAFRIQAILLSLEGRTTGQIAHLLNISRGTVPLWIHNWNSYQETGLLEGHRCGRKSQLNWEDWEKLADIIESGPVA